MILVCGEALFDVFLKDEDAGSHIVFDAAPGGSPFNVAIGLARLGRPTGFFSGLSRDLFGRRLQTMLAREQIDASHCVLTEAPTTLAFVEIGRNGAARYAFRGDGAADRMIAASDLPAPGADVRALVFGSYSTVVAPAGDSLLALAEREKERRVIIYDPNVRLGVVSDPDAWRARFDAFAETATILKLSEEDLAILAPGAAAADFARAALAQGVALVVVTRGGEGCVAFGPFGETRAPAAAGAVLDTIGAGDAVTAALIARLDERGLLDPLALRMLDRDQAADALGFAIRAAAITCGRRGADMPRRAELG